MIDKVHRRIETIAGAIALGEASDAERLEYREHLSQCARCLNDLAGEFELERSGAAIAAARDSETWTPDVQDSVLQRIRRPSPAFRVGASIFAGALAVSLIVHLVAVAGVARLTPTFAAPLVINAGSTRIVLEQRAAPAPPAARPPAPQRRLVVYHNVVQMTRSPVTARPFRAPQNPQIEAIVVHPSLPDPPPQRVQDPVWRTGDPAWRTIAKTTTTALTETAPQGMSASAESMQLAPGYSSREIQPVGGETAINPQPPLIAYDEGAQGTSVFEVMVDERGLPTKCVITKPAGYPVLDVAACRAAMKARYLPKIVDGKAVAGVYHDAFTFQMNDSSSSQEGIPPAVP